MTKKLIPVQEAGVQAALAAFLQAVLTRDDIDMIFTPVRMRSGAVTHALVADPGILAQADPLAPVLPVNGAAQMARLTVREPRKRIAAVLRPCELRAFVELVKLKQASFEGVTVIGIDCLGTYPVPDFMADHIEAIPQGVETGAIKPATGYRFRDACQMCEQPVPGAGADIKIELLGADLRAGVPVDVPEVFADLPVLRDGAEAPGRAAAVERLVAARTARRDADFAETREQLRSGGGMGDIFAACIHCMNCQQVCPICYCKVCVFRGQIFDYPPEKYAAWAGRKGALRMPTDTLLFHLTRLNHMAVSCVGCGMCTEACPSALPVGQVFRAVGADVQAAFEYLPGQSVDEPLPLVTFKENEWNEVGEE
ncbi:MAG: formate dehydrogenase [Anaerolineae bacterium]|nr:formate dehydrogenase [Anaerolineae bacterium]